MAFGCVCKVIFDVWNKTSGFQFNDINATVIIVPKPASILKSDVVTDDVKLIGESGYQYK